MSPRSTFKLVLIGVLASSLALVTTSCTITNPYTDQRQASDLSKGAAIGAASGAVVGALSGSHNRNKRALIGGLVGALAGTGVGYYMDTQAAQLRQKLSGTGVSVTRNGDYVNLNMPGNVTFATGSADLRPEFFSVLNSVATVLKEYNKTLIQITGFTDTTGTVALNQRLSEQRAQSVGAYLHSQGIQPVRIVTQGLGQSNPIASNTTADGRQQNRRVELQLEPVTQADMGQQ